VLEALERRSGPSTLAALIAATGLHENTVREHLDALLAQGRVRRHRTPPSGRGRPAWQYEPAATDSVSGGRAEYAGLAATLAAVIQRTSPSPRQDAVAAGTMWGHELAHASPAVTARLGNGMAGPVRDAAARQLVVALLAELGFDPRPDEATTIPATTTIPANTTIPAITTTTVNLTRCPLLHAARRYPDVVCGVHLGIVRGVLAELGADGTSATLAPFSSPGACRLDLPAPVQVPSP
jgi:predicted ArsR family transcriptional regulator